MAVIGKQQTSDVAIGTLFKSEPGAASAGIEKPIRLFGQQLSLIAGAISGHQPVALAEDAPALAAVSLRTRGDAGWRAKAPALRKPLRSGHCAAPAPLRRPSGVLVVHGRKTQQQSNFFLDFDDRLGALQPLCQEPVVALQLSMFRRQWIGRGDLGAAFDRAQRFKGAGGALARDDWV